MNDLSIRDLQEEIDEYDQALLQRLLNQYKDVHVLINQLLRQVFLAEKKDGNNDQEKAGTHQVRLKLTLGVYLDLG